MTNPSPTVLVPEWLTVDEVAAALKVTPWTVRHWAKKGEIEYRRYGNLLRFNAGKVLGDSSDTEKAP